MVNKFQEEDWVIASNVGMRNLQNIKGRILQILPSQQEEKTVYTVEFFEDIRGHNGNAKYDRKDERIWNLPESHLKPIPTNEEVLQEIITKENGKTRT